MEDQPNFVTSPFDALRHLDGEREYWLAREVSKVLGYTKWDKFEGVIAKAKIACKYNGHPVEQEFHETTKQRKVGARGGRADIRDIELTRYACYMIVLDADSSKPIVSHAKDYFAEQTRRQELADADTFAQLSEDEKRLVYRVQLSLYNRKLAQTAHEAGVVTQSEHADFANSGYKGLYNELTENDIHALKHLAPGEEISNWMGPEELADNIFRAAQTDATMKREKTASKEQANTTHYRVARKVREFIITELGNTPPEQLPTPRKSTWQLQREEEKRAKQGGQLQLPLFEAEQEESSGNESR
ncbi:MAG: DNA damage-inducible protein D [Chloroflexota bacterium]|nr:DNA damage-inducible protein D [Chloroflexota bacterium]